MRHERASSAAGDRDRRRVVAAAYAVPLCVLPSATWRLGVVWQELVASDDPCGAAGLGEAIYVAGLSGVSLAAAFLTVGLVRPWGEVVPRWLPIVGGRTVPVRGATFVAGAGAALVALVTVFALLTLSGAVGREQPPAEGCHAPGFGVMALYVPLLAWAPLTAYVTAQYYRRRTGRD